MEFFDLYKLAQTIISDREAAGKRAAIVPVAELRDAMVAEVEWLEAINFHPVDARKEDPLGHYECHADTDSRWEDPNSWVALITYKQDLNVCQQRFVWCKEMMHVFDTVEGSVKTPDEHRGLLQEIEMKPLEPTQAYLSENQAKWLALLILCPKEQRDRLKAQWDSKALSDYEVALALRIPEVIVTSLFSDYYVTYYDRFIASHS